MDAPCVAPSRVTQKIFAVLVEWYHRSVLTMSFKLVSFLHLYMGASTCYYTGFHGISNRGDEVIKRPCLGSRQTFLWQSIDALYALQRRAVKNPQWLLTSTPNVMRKFFQVDCLGWDKTERDLSPSWVRTVLSRRLVATGMREATCDRCDWRCVVDKVGMSWDIPRQTPSEVLRKSHWRKLWASTPSSAVGLRRSPIHDRVQRYYVALLRPSAALSVAPHPRTSVCLSVRPSRA